MNIGEAATQAGLPAKTIRYYEDIGLVKPRRDSNGYRAFVETDIHKLTFLAEVCLVAVAHITAQRCLRWQELGQLAKEIMIRVA